MDELERKIERILLPPQMHFSNQQRTILHAEGSCNIIAGPGSGKTTVIAAKFAYLLKKTKEERGICLITHTNVAVEEVLERLNRMGIEKVEYPNFIGTIQEFINHFLALKAYRMLKPNSNFQVLGDKEYTEKYDKMFRSSCPWYNHAYPVPSYKKHAGKLIVTDERNVDFIVDTHKKYDSVLSGCFKRLFNRGIITNRQSIELGLWYLEQHEEKLRNAFMTRYQYVFLDEAQDTNQLQYTMLNRLLKNTTISFQKFGDPYQALYSMYEHGEDAWNPLQEENENPNSYLEIAETARFGAEIANVVRNVCIEQYDNFKSVSKIKSFSPYFIIYNDGEDLRSQYRGLIEYCENQSESYKQCEDSDAILADRHDCIAQLFPKYVPQKQNSTEFNLNYNLFFGTLTQWLNDTFEISNHDIVDHIKGDVQRRTQFAELLKKLFQNNIDAGEVQEYMNNLFSEELATKIDIGKCERLLKNIDCLFKKKQLTAAMDPYPEVHLSTIHGAKGETHRSTLLILDSTLDGKNLVDVSDLVLKTHLNTFLDKCKAFLVGNRIKVDTDEKLKSALKLAYVALSRPRYLTVIGIPKGNDNEQLNNQLIHAGWKLASF